MEDPTKPPPAEYLIALPNRSEFASPEVWAAAKAFLQAEFPHLLFSVGQTAEEIDSDELLVMPVMASMIDGGRVVPIASRDRAAEMEIRLALKRFDPNAKRLPN